MAGNRNTQYNEYDVQRYAAQRRKPSYDAEGNVRGFRSRPGSPLADPTNNIPMGGYAPGLTSQTNWDRLFRNRVTGATPSSLAAQRGDMSAQGRLISEGSQTTFEPPANPSTTPTGVTEDERFGGGMTPIDIASQTNGIPHAQRWSTPPKPRLANGWMSGGGTNAKWSQLKQGGTTFTNVKSPFGWGSSFT